MVLLALLLVEIYESSGAGFVSRPFECTGLLLLPLAAAA